jgi:hypothetical protein
MFNSALKETLLKNITATDNIYNYSNVLLYHEKTKDSCIGFMDFPKYDEIMSKVECILTEELNYIKERVRKDIHPYEKVSQLNQRKFIRYIKENICVNLTDKVTSLPICDRFDTPEWDLEILASLENIKLDTNKTFLENIHLNMITNNLVMKSILPCMMLGNNDFRTDYDSVYDSSYRFIEYIINFIYTQGINHDELNDTERVPLLIIEELAEEKPVELYMASKEDFKNIILILIFNSRHVSYNVLDYMFMKNTEIIRMITRNIYPHGGNNIGTDTDSDFGGQDIKK